MKSNDKFTIFCIVFVCGLIIFGIIMLRNSNTSEKDKYLKLEEDYYSLEREYESLYEKYDNVCSDISKIIDYYYIFYDYFEDKSISFESAYNAFDKIATILAPYY